MKGNNVQKIIDSINRNLEEKISQMSQIRLIAETISHGIHEPRYFVRICEDLLEIFSASVCIYFRFRHRDPSGWFPEHWISHDDILIPEQKWIPEAEEGFLGWVRTHRKPCYLENVEDDSFIRIWGGGAFPQAIAALIPILDEENIIGILALIDPHLNLSPENINPQLGVISSLINSGYRNHLLYRELQSSEEEYRDLFENSSDMVLVVYPDGVIRDCNHVFKEIIKPKTNLRGRKIFEYIADRSNQNFSDCWSRLLEGHEVRNEDIYLTCEDGGEVEAELSGNARVIPDGHVGVIRLYLRDETERREAERKRLELELELQLSHQRHLAQVGFYVSGIVHNLRNPIQVIFGYIDALKLQRIDIPELDFMKQATKNMIDIIENILTKLRKESSIEATEVDLNMLLQSEMEFLKANYFFKHEIIKRFNFTENLPPVRGLYGDFSQAIMNIIYNALDAMKDCDEKKLRLTTFFNKDQDMVCISISDTGPGIPKELHKRIFQPFFTTKTANNESSHGIFSGSGLGLSNSLALIKHYSGKIEFTTKPNAGTTFIISIPAANQSNKNG